MGYEAIWGIKRTDSLSKRLDEAGITLQNVRGWSDDELEKKLASSSFDGLTLHSFGHVDFALCAKQIATYTDELAIRIKACSTSEDVEEIHQRIYSIHGFGETIASKAIKYWFREIGVGAVAKSDFPVGVVSPILNEIHNQQASKIFAALDTQFISNVASTLRERGDPFAIDALFYLHRGINEKKWLSEAGAAERTFRAVDPLVQAVASENGRWGEILLQRMQEQHRKSGVRGMKTYYESCVLSSKARKHAEIQSAKGIRTLEGEYPRFFRAYYGSLLGI